MINIFTLICSSRRNGVNEILGKKINEILSYEFRTKNMDTNLIIKYIDDYNIKPCSGCQVCFKKGECIYKDDQLVFLRDLESANIIVFCVPVYINNIPGNLKVLLDRIAYFVHLMPYLGKKGIILTTSSLSGLDIVERYMEMICSYLGISVNLSLKYYDLEKDIKSEDLIKLKNYVESYLNKSFEIPLLLRQVFDHYYKLYLPYKNDNVDIYELEYWKQKYLKHKSIEEVLDEISY